MGVSRKWVLFFLAAVILVAAMNAVVGSLNDIKRSGELQVSGLKETVRVVRDEKGMAYVYAQNGDDLFFAQGFITAQDRLFTMELFKLVIAGRLTEVLGDTGATGEKAKKSDIRMRTIGFYRQAKQHAALLGDIDRNRLQNYVNGVNAYLDVCKSERPLESKLMGIPAETWTIADSLAILYYMGWGSSANLKTEIVAQLLVEKLGPQKARAFFPLNINPDDPSGKPLGHGIQPVDRPLISLQQLKDVIPLIEDTPLQIGSNNWVTSARLSVSGKPILVNDPHLQGNVLPAPFYPMGLITPEFRAVGVNVPGSPGMVVGRTDHIAFGVTNGYADIQDLYVETLYSENLDQYMQDGRSFPLEIVKEVLKIKDSTSITGFREETIDVKLTKRGPVVSGLFDDLKSKKVLSLRWSPFESMGTGIGFLDLLEAKDVYEARAALRHVNIIMLNIVLADTSGNIAWQTSGRVPVRSEADGTVPFVVKTSRDDWQGWIPWDEMPHEINPKKGWLGTANHATVTNAYPYYFSSHFSPNWRYSRIKELMSTPGQKNAEDHWAYQRDTKNLMAVSIAPILAAALKNNQTTAGLARILSDWNFHDEPDQIAPTVFQALLLEVFKQSVEDELGKELAGVMAKETYFWQQRLVAAMERGQGEWFDDIRTEGHKESMQEIIVRSGLIVKQMLIDKYGANPNWWTWGKVHQVDFVSLIRRSGFGSRLLGGGSYAMPGSGQTLYRARYSSDKPFDSSIFSVLRMVADLGDPDKVLAVIPGGVSARMLDPHRTDQIKPFMDGTKLYWWFSDEAIAQHTRAELNLRPGTSESGTEQ